MPDVISLRYPALRSMVEKILRSAGAFYWTLHGFGMLQLHLNDETFLNVWDSRFRTPGVSGIHDHPWSFETHVIAGAIVNRRYLRGLATGGRPLGDRGEPEIVPMRPSPLVEYHTGRAVDDDSRTTNNHNVWLQRRDDEFYTESQSYKQGAREIHSQHPEDGTVALGVVTPNRFDTERANVFWPKGTDWVPPQSKPANPVEIEDITEAALTRWFGGR